MSKKVVLSKNQTSNNHQFAYIWKNFNIFYTHNSSNRNLIWGSQKSVPTTSFNVFFRLSEFEMTKWSKSLTQLQKHEGTDLWTVNSSVTQLTLFHPACDHCSATPNFSEQTPTYRTGPSRVRAVQNSGYCLSGVLLWAASGRAAIRDFNRWIKVRRAELF